MSFFKKIKHSRLQLIALVAVLALAFGQTLIPTSHPFSSVEVAIAEHSPNGPFGGAVVPASCPSYSHDPNGCPACGSNQIYSPTTIWVVDSNGYPVAESGPDTCADCPSGQVANADHTACVTACAPSTGQSCTSSNACGSNYGTVQCNGACSATAPICTPPTVSINGTSPSVTVLAGKAVTVTWSCPNPNTSSSGSSNNPSSPFSTGAAVSGSKSIVVTGNTTFTVQCNPTGAQASVSAAVINPTLTLSASPSRVRSGNASTLTWSANSVQSCTLSGPNLSVSATADGSGTIPSRTASTGPILGRSVYTLTCQTAGGSLSTSVTVTLIPNVIEI